MMTEQLCLEELSNNLDDHPHCPHGPTLLFSREGKSGRRKFYACSACRDRKLCRFFLWTDEKYSDERRIFWEAEQRKFIGEKSHEELYYFVCNLKPLISKQKLSYCHTCCIFLQNINRDEHIDHTFTLNVSLDNMMHPTEFLKPLECDKREAQYLFSKESTNTIISVAKRNDINSILSIGAPRIHEFIKTSNIKMYSLLLDLDRRYHMFYEPREFCWFNSFNNHFFFGNNSKQFFVEFLKKSEGKLAIILDPPFGGRLEPLANTLHSIQSLCRLLNPHLENDCPVLLIYPYFMEQHVVSCLPSFRMVDYRVSYDNHSSFFDKKSNKRGSPVRIFTNMSLEKVILPIEEGYKFCNHCICWVHSDNKHCKFCNKCTSKSGSPYVHCFKCKLCVKASWRHCNECEQCALPLHECISLATSLVKCYLCGEQGHKQQNCVQKKTRDSSQVINIAKIKKRKWNVNHGKHKKTKKMDF